MERWEYLILDHYRGIHTNKPQEIADMLRRHFPTQRSIKLDVAYVKIDVGLMQLMNALGAEGWESVGATNVIEGDLLKRRVA